ncbi:MAG: hypothetical protein GY874_00875 [Desulfobacteraceae bacterium]|nr:hypothetical protein [Desulfobacteraceae bacterium]
MLDEGSLDPKRYKKMLIHTIEAENGIKDLNALSKLNTEWDFFLYLKKAGQKVADDWLEDNFESIGRRSTLDLRSLIH